MNITIKYSGLHNVTAESLKAHAKKCGASIRAHVFEPHRRLTEITFSFTDTKSMDLFKRGYFSLKESQFCTMTQEMV